MSKGDAVVVLLVAVVVASGAVAATVATQSRVEVPTWRGWSVGSVGPGTDITQHTAALFHGSTVVEVSGWSKARFADPVRGYVILDRWEAIEGDLGPYQRHVESSLPIGLWQLEADVSFHLADITTTGANPDSPGYLVPDGQVDVQDLTTFQEAWVSATSRTEAE